MLDLSRTVGGRAFGCPIGARLMPPSAGHRPGGSRQRQGAGSWRERGRVPWARRRIVRSHTPTPPCTDRALGLLIPVASNPIRFSKPVSFSGRAGRIFPLRTAPFLSDQRVPGRKFIIADTDHTRSILGCIRPVNIHRCLEAIQLPIVAAEKFATDPGHQPHDCPRHAGLPPDRLTPAEKGKIRSHPDFCTNVALQR
jgi:hypothetical protein